MPETAEQYIGRILGYVEGRDAIKGAAGRPQQGSKSRSKA